MRILQNVLVSFCVVLMTSAGLSQTIADQPASTQTTARPANRVEGVVYADQFPGDDMGVRIAAAIASLGRPPNGIVDAKGFATGSILSAFTIPRGVVVYLPCGLFTVTGTIVMNEGSSLFGCQSKTDLPPIAGNKNGTVLSAARSLAGDVIRLEASGSTNCNSAYWADNTRLAFVAIYGTGGAAGNGVTICQQGENSTIHDVAVFHAAQDGFSFVGNSAGEHLNYNLQSSKNGRYGFSFNSMLQSETIAGVGGDDNASSLVYFNGLNGSNLTLIGLKSESYSAVTHQDPAVQIYPTNEGYFEAPAALHIIGGYATGVSGHSDAIRISNANASVELEGWDVPYNTYKNVIHDTVNSQVISSVSGHLYPHILYAGKGEALLVVGNVNVNGSVNGVSVAAKNVTASELISGNCVQAGAGGKLTTTTGPCGGSRGSGSDQYWSFSGCRPAAYNDLVSCFGTATLPEAYSDTNYLVEGCNSNSGNAASGVVSVTGALTPTGFPYVFTLLMNNGAGSGWSPTVTCHVHHL